MFRLKVISAALVFSCASIVNAQLVRTGSGADPASITGAVNEYRADLGTQNPNTAGSFGAGRREINWDGVPDNFAAPNALPGDFFNVNSPRGAVFSTPGTSVQVSADDSNPTSSAVRFANINPTYSSIFQTFSAQRLFSPIGSNVVEMRFFVPGSTTPALSRGFGALYADVDGVSGAEFQFFDAAGAPLATFAVPVSNNGLSFLGISYSTPVVSRVRIVYGNTALGPNDDATHDVAVMDDFIYGEPVAVPEPTMMAGVLTIALVIRRCR